MLTHPDSKLQFIVEVDASSTGIGAVLSQGSPKDQKVHPCAFFSRKLSPAEKNYDFGNRELLVVVAALQEWRHWLEGSEVPFLVLTDHKNLLYLQSAKRLNSRQARWALFLSCFNFALSYRPGSRNAKPDALSRIHKPSQEKGEPETILPASRFIRSAVWDIERVVLSAQQQDPDPGSGPKDSLFVPASVKAQVLQWGHSSKLTCHPGVNRTLRFLQQRFWWPGMGQVVREFVAAYSVCCRGKSSHRPPSNSPSSQTSLVPHRR